MTKKPGRKKKQEESGKGAVPYTDRSELWNDRQYVFFMPPETFKKITIGLNKSEYPREMCLWAMGQMLLKDYKSRGWVLYHNDTLRVRSLDDIAGDTMLLFQTTLPEYSNKQYLQHAYVLWQGWISKEDFGKQCHTTDIHGTPWYEMYAVDLKPPKELMLCIRPVTVSTVVPHSP